jgi:hypothetical protein
MGSKETYEAPEMEVLEIKAEGVICESGGMDNYNRTIPVDW